MPRSGQFFTCANSSQAPIAPYGLAMQGTALYYALKIDTIARHPYAGWMLHWAPLYKFLTHATMFMELNVPFLLLLTAFHPTLRCLLVFMFMGLHVGMGLCMRIGTFPAVCIVAWLACMPGRFWDRCAWPESERKATGQSLAQNCLAFCAIAAVLAANVRNLRSDMHAPLPGSRFEMIDQQLKVCQCPLAHT